MSHDFWSQLNKPFIGLSPMDGITDLPFRLITAKYGKPDVIFTEFIAVEALIRGIERAFADLLFLDVERPIVAQLYGNDPKLFYGCSQIIAELGFDGVDINMGCPAKSVQQRGAGAGLIQTPDLAVEIIHAVQQGVQDWAENGINYEKFPQEAKPVRIKRQIEQYKIKKQELTTTLLEWGFLESKNEESVGPRKIIPVSVKTRTGYSEPNTKDWIETIASTQVAAISLHGRTLRQAYKGLADWDEISKAVKCIKDLKGSKTIIIGNGDVKSVSEGEQRSAESGVDGVLIGRASIGNPWVFNKELIELSWEDIKQVMLIHSKLHYQIKDQRAFVQMRRILAEYIKGCEGAPQIRQQLVRVNKPQVVEKILNGLDKPTARP